MKQSEVAPIVALDHVSKAFSGRPVIRDFSLAVERGEIVALLGRTGAGKSTVLNLVLGALRPDRGQVRVAGWDPAADIQELRGKIAVSFQTDRLMPWRTAVENVAFGLLVLGNSKKQARTKALEWLSRVKLDGAEDRYPHELSGGMRQRVSLARALAVDPELLLLDESFSQLDQVTSRSLRSDVQRINRQFGKTCLMVTHRIDDALELADRVLVLGEGARIVLERRLEAYPAGAGQLATLTAEITEALGAAPTAERNETLEATL